MQLYMCVTRRFLSCLFFAGVFVHDSGSLFVCSVSQYCMYGTDDVASLLMHNKVHFHYVPHIFFAKGAWGRFSALDKLFFPSCELHVLLVVLTSRQPTPHT